MLHFPAVLIVEPGSRVLPQKHSLAYSRPMYLSPRLVQLPAQYWGVISSEATNLPLSACEPVGSL
jgi:hypothetical protein